MKLISSSSTSCSTNNSTYSEGSNNTNGNYNSKFSCNIYGMFRRLLCSNSVPTHPTLESDYMSRLSSCHEKLDDDQQKTPLPGVVARLMGLDSMPTTTNTCNSRSMISRSRSMSSVDSLRQLESSMKSRDHHHHHRHSFREPPTLSYSELMEDENFFILSFERGTKQGKTEAEIKQRRRRRRKDGQTTTNNKENYLHVNTKVSTHQKVETDKVIISQKLRDSSNILRSMSDNCLIVGMEVVKSPKAIKLIQDSQLARNTIKTKNEDENFCGEKFVTESDSEKSSPNSVLDYVETQKSEKLSRLTSSKSRRTLSEELENYRKLKLIIGDNEEEAKIKSDQRRNSDDQSWKKEYNKDENHVHLWKYICRLATRETAERRNWPVQNEIEAIGGGLGLEILDQLVEELVYQLVGDQPL